MAEDIIVFHAQKGFLGEGGLFTADLQRAVSFRSPEEAERALDDSHAECVFQFKATALARADQWDAVLLEDLRG